MSWRWRDLMEESWRRVSGLQLVFALLVSAVLFSVGLLAVLGLREAIAASQLREDAGVSVFTVSAAPGSDLSAASCSRIGRSEPVVSAGPYFGEYVAGTVAWIPAAVSVPLYDVSLGALRTWWPDAPASGGLYVGRDLSATTGLGQGVSIAVGGSVETVTGVLPRAVDPDILQASLVRVVAPLARASECWFRLKPGYGNMATAIASAAFPDSEVVVAPFARADLLSVDPGAALRRPAEQWAWLGGALLCLVLLAMQARVSRIEYGIYRVTGTSWGTLALMDVVQIALLVTFGVAVADAGVLLVLSLFREMPIDGRSVWYVLSPTLVAALAVMALAPWVRLAAVGGAITDSMKV